MKPNWRVKRIKVIWKGGPQREYAIATKIYDPFKEKLPSDSDWQIFILSPIEGVPQDKIIQETSKFLTFEEGYQFGVIIEGDWIGVIPKNAKDFLSKTMAPQLLRNLMRLMKPARGKPPISPPKEETM